MTDNSWDGILQPGERLLWQGKPGTRLSPRPGEIGESLFGLFFIGFSVVWMRTAYSISGGPFWMFGLIFFSIGVYQVVGKYLWRAYQRAHTWYTLSDRAAYIASDTFLGGRRLKRYPLGPDTQVDADPGRGSIHFAQETYSVNGRTRSAQVGFEQLDNPGEVLELITDVVAGTAER